MIVQEIINETLVRTYSDQNIYIHGGSPESDYIEAIDLISENRTYIETNIPIELDVTEEEYSQVGKIFMGVNE